MKSKILKILKQEYKMAVGYELSHVIKFVSLALGGVITSILFCVLWLASSKLGYDAISEKYILSYFLLVLLCTRLITDVSVKFTMSSITRGDFSKYLIKPFSYLTEVLGVNLGEQILQTLFVLPFVILGGYLLRNYLIYDITPYTVFLFIMAVLMAHIIKFLSSQIFSLFAFTVKENQGLRILYENAVIIFSGEIIPYVALSDTFVMILRVLPFRYMLSFPMEILMGGMRPYDLSFGFIIGSVWIILLFIMYKIGYAVNIKKYEAEGI